MTAAALLAKVPVFSGLTADDLGRLAARAQEIRLTGGTVLWEEGSPPEALYVVIEGEFAITKAMRGGGEPAGDEALLNVCGPGEVLGEMSLLEQAPRSATVRATRDSAVLRVGADEFQEACDQSPAMTRAILRVVLARLRNTESVLRQFDKLTALGKIAAGIAHELNNPAAALRRGADTLADALAALRRVALQLHGLDLDAAQVERLTKLAEDPHTPGPVEALGVVARGEREEEVNRVLEAAGVADPWAIAPALVAAGWREASLDALARELPLGSFGTVARWLGLSCAAGQIAGEIGAGAGRISDIVQSVRAYSHLGRAPIQWTDVHEGIESALVLLGHKLRGLRVRRAYAADLPRIEAYAGELNQVWTNLIDNAVDAMGGEGELEIRTAPAGDGVRVAIVDSGPGIPPAVHARLFEPFFTTKPPGAGTGLGLHIAYDVVVRKHRGRIDVESRPGRTSFDVTLPVRPGTAEER